MHFDRYTRKSPEVVISSACSAGPKLKLVVGITKLAGNTLSHTDHTQGFESNCKTLTDKLLKGLNNRFEGDEFLIKACSVVKLEIGPQSWLIKKVI